MKKNKILQIITLFVILLLLAAESFGKATVVHMSDDKLATIHIKPGMATVISFPVKPMKVISGSRHFSIQYIKNDLAIGARKVGLKSNLFVYMEGRRYGFNLVSVAKGPFS